MGDIVFDDDIGMSGVRHGYYAGTDHAGAYDTFVCGERQKLGKHKRAVICCLPNVICAAAYVIIR